MAGPGLTKWTSHHAIHQAAFDETARLTRLLRQAMAANERQGALYLASALIEYWQMHTLQHAEAEETGWYREILAARPDLQADVIALTRDHELLRILLAEIHGLLATRGMTSGIVERFEAMLLVNSIHSREEERRLLGGDERADDQYPPDQAMASDAALSLTSPEEIIPLAVARPSLHAQLMALLRARGLHPGDLQASIRSGADGPLLRVTYGQTHPQTGEWRLPDEGNTTAIEELFSHIVERCEVATKEDYATFMHLTG